MPMGIVIRWLLLKAFFNRPDMVCQTSRHCRNLAGHYADGYAHLSFSSYAKKCSWLILAAELKLVDERTGTH